LNVVEQAQFERHPVIGFELLRDETTPLLKLAAEIALTHHEQWSGAGYPMGLEGVEIPLSGRIVAVADALEDQLAATPACGAAAFAAGVEVVAAGAGTRFDPAVIRSLRASVAALRRIHDHFNTSDPADTDWSTADPAA
jgi:putative two-component system response regulator